MNWTRPIHRTRGRQTEARGHHPPVTTPLARDRRQRARAALNEAEARTSEPEPVAIAEWPHGRHGETLRVYLTVFQGRAYAHARRFYRDDATGDLKPGKGLGVHVDNLPALTRAFGEAMTRARELGWLSEDPETPPHRER